MGKTWEAGPKAPAAKAKGTSKPHPTLPWVEKMLGGATDNGFAPRLMSLLGWCQDGGKYLQLFSLPQFQEQIAASLTSPRTARLVMERNSRGNKVSPQGLGSLDMRIDKP